MPIRAWLEALRNRSAPVFGAKASGWRRDGAGEKLINMTSKASEN
ncbi:hypothetical protein DET61_10788 [Marinobacter nauticus]|jgi:hypothetical protein|uniref:Uncharacterized protein n=1 Tax=Marinobacter nauticus TaxID=2743 RepID=A0A368XL95_MARNT|nr:hypothetical protein Q673_09420 [Marinobacter sp. EN3]KAE8545653.1 hypothetical protein F6453_1847 [Marinobacter nauticus]RCW68349.1 hypothetical protein DET61_10788 [Marinobacter nauticus]